jgi:hypothetical protein
MIKVSAGNYHDSLQMKEEEITLNGPPQLLTGTIVLKNKEAQNVFIRELTFTAAKTKETTPVLPESFKVLTSLAAGEERVQQVSLQMPLDTPPGQYIKTLMIGGKEKSVRLIVQPNIEIDINPQQIHFQGAAAGKTYTAEISLANNGNLPFKIPSNIKHTTMLDEDYLCRALSLAIRERGKEGFDPTMDELTRNIHKEMTDWVEVRLEESGKTVEPGKSIQLHLSITLPRNVNSSRDYSGNIRIWDQTIAYRINAFEDTSTPK